MGSGAIPSGPRWGLQARDGGELSRKGLCLLTSLPGASSLLCDRPHTWWGGHSSKQDTPHTSRSESSRIVEVQVLDLHLSFSVPQLACLGKGMTILPLRPSLSDGMIMVVSAKGGHAVGSVRCGIFSWGDRDIQISLEIRETFPEKVTWQRSGQEVTRGKGGKFCRQEGKEA